MVLGFFWLILLLYNSLRPAHAFIGLEPAGLGKAVNPVGSIALHPHVDTAQVQPFFKPRGWPSFMLHEASAFSHIWMKHRSGRQKGTACSPAGIPKAVLGHEALSSWFSVDGLFCRVGVLSHLLQTGQQSHGGRGWTGRGDAERLKGRCKVGSSQRCCCSVQPLCSLGI